jgi:hypothetical protein
LLRLLTHSCVLAPLVAGISINFAKRLAHNDKKVRDSSVKSLRRWLIRRETLEESDLLKIWKGLFYCFWMSDKVAVQQQLADALSDLLLPPLPFDRALLLFDTCLMTLRREWTAIDQLRMDKFMTLARRFIQKAFMTLQAGEWETSQVESLTDVILSTGALAPDTTARGFAFHVIDCFLTEVERVSAAQPDHPVSFDAFNTLLTPFYHILARGRDRTLVERVQKEVFDTLREVCATPIHAAEEIAAAAQPKPKRAKQQKKKKKVPAGDDDMEDDEDEEEEEEQLPQAVGAAAEYPSLHAVLHGNADKIAAIFFAMAADTSVAQRHTRTRHILASSLASTR